MNVYAKLLLMTTLLKNLFSLKNKKSIKRARKRKLLI